MSEAYTRTLSDVSQKVKKLEREVDRLKKIISSGAIDTGRDNHELIRILQKRQEELREYINSKVGPRGKLVEWAKEDQMKIRTLRDDIKDLKRHILRGWRRLDDITKKQINNNKEIAKIKL